MLSLQPFLDPAGGQRYQPCKDGVPFGKGSSVGPSSIEFVFLLDGQHVSVWEDDVELGSTEV